MVRNYILIAVRNIRKGGVFSVINIAGLAIGMACSILILIWVDHELSYDRFHPGHKDIYRLGFRARMLGTSLDVPVAMAPLAGVLKETFSGIDDVVRIDVPENVNVNVKNEHYVEPLFIRADSSFFSFFGFELETGDPARVLSHPFSIVITRDMARKYFGDENPVGEVIRLNNAHDYRVTGIAANPPTSSHISFSAVVPFMSLYETRAPGSMDQWLNLSYFTYFRANRSFREAAFFESLTDLFEERFGEQSREYGIDLDPFLQPVTSIHLNSNMLIELTPPGNKASVYIFFTVSVFILLLACINFMNLSTAKSSLRSKEVGVRKVSGASRGQLVGQFLGESVIYTLIAALLAVPLVELGLPYFNNITNLDLSFFSTSNHRILAAFPLFVVFVGLVAGSYPSFVLSAWNPVRTLRGGKTESRGRSWLRSGLILFQLIISVTLVVCTMFVWKQLNYINSKDLGFTKHDKIIVNLITRDIQSRYQVIDQHLQGVPGVNGIAFSSVFPGEEFSGTVFKPEGAEEESIINYMYADPRYCGLMDIRLVEGRDFDPAFATDSMAVLVNETAVRTFGWSDPVGMTIGRSHGENQFETYTVIGVVGDFHFRSMHKLVEPLIIRLLRGNPRYMTVDILPVNFHLTIAGIKEAWDKINPDDPFEFTLLSDKYDFHYRADIQLGRIFTFFSLLAFLIAALGMYGLSAFMVENRTKEIGVRKVFGASERSIVLIFFRQFGWWLLIANIVSWVVAWYFTGKWLEMFAYRIPVENPFIFAGAALMSVFVVFIASGYQSLKAALIDPARSLRYE
jgi:putative ABC transport system permease protein